MSFQLYSFCLCAFVCMSTLPELIIIITIVWPEQQGFCMCCYQPSFIVTLVIRIITSFLARLSFFLLSVSVFDGEKTDFS